MKKQKFLKLRISEQLYNSFHNKCKSKNKTMSIVLRNFSKYYSENDNVILLNLDDNLLKKTMKLCKDKNMNFETLIKNLLKIAIKKNNK